MRRRILIVLGVVVLIAGALLAIGAKDDASKGTTYRMLFDNANGISDGGDFKVAGVRAGSTSAPDVVRRNGRALALVKVKVTEPGFAELRSDARCEITPQSFIGEYYVDCQPGTAGKKLGDDGLVPVEHTSSPVGIDLLNDILRQPYRERLRLIVNELGTGLAGRSDDLNEVLRRAHPGLRETSQTLRILGRQTRQLKSLVSDGHTVLSALARRRTDVSRFVREAGRTSTIAAARREQLAQAFARLPAFLGELRPYVNRLGDLAVAQQPVLRNLRASSDQLDTFLTRLPRFADVAQPALTSLGRASEVGTRAVRATDEEIAELRKLAKGTPGLAKPLRQLLETADDRRRAVEPDDRAAATDPPAPDKTHISGQGGFTGMEAIWNFFYWQALTTNGMDDLGHILRIGLKVDLAGCSQYTVLRPTTNPSAFDKCNQWLGPYQPGINAPDPTRTTAAPATTAKAAPAKATTVSTGSERALLDYLLRP